MSDKASELEQLSAELHEVYQKEATRQGDVRHAEEYKDLPERIKDFDRALARYIIAREQSLKREHERALEKQAMEVQECVLSECKGAINLDYESIINILLDTLESIADALDNELGDTDPDFPENMTDEEIKEEDPVFWACQKAYETISRLRNAN